MNEQAFVAWLQANHYRRTSIKKTLLDLKRAPSTDENVQLALRRYVTFAHASGVEDELTRLATSEGVGDISRLPKEKPKRRKLDAVSFQESDWQKLAGAVTGSIDPRDQVLWIMYTTGLRVGDVLRIERHVLDKAVKDKLLAAERKGGTFVLVPLGLPEPWVALQRGMDQFTATSTVAAYVTGARDGNPDAGGAAYQRIDRRLKYWQRELKLSGRVHSHRLRRTVATHGYAETNDPVAVMQMLGNTSMAATQKYIDELNVERVRSMQQRIAKR